MANIRKTENYKDLSINPLSSPISAGVRVTIDLNQAEAGSAAGVSTAAAKYVFSIVPWGPAAATVLTANALAIAANIGPFGTSIWIEIQVLPTLRPTGLPKYMPLGGDGTLLKGSSAHVYVVENGQRRHLSPAAWAARGYRNDDIIVVPDQELGKIPEGPPIL